MAVTEQAVKDLLEPWKTAIKDIRYLLSQYGDKYPDDTIETIRKIVNKPEFKGGNNGKA
jgi:hypothetical protein